MSIGVRLAVFAVVLGAAAAAGAVVGATIGPDPAHEPPAIERTGHDVGGHVGEEG